MSTISPSMSLIIPSVGITDGPEYALEINQSLTLIDQHDHSPGKGVQITPASINVNTELTFNGYSATNLKSLALAPQSSITTINTIYDTSGDLYFNDGVGNTIRLTQAGGIAGTPGSITGLVPPASATYYPVSKTFVFQSNVNIAANLDAGSILLRNLTPNSTFALTLSPPAGLASNYTLTLPALPVASAPLLLAPTGVISTGQITNVMMATNSVDTAQIVDMSVTPAKRSALGQVRSSSSGTFITTSAAFADITNLSVTITTTGRPIMILFTTDTTNSAASVMVTSSTDRSPSAQLRLIKDSIAFALVDLSQSVAVGIASQGVGSIASQGTSPSGANTGITAGANTGITVDDGAANFVVPPNMTFFDTPTAGSHTYVLQTRLVSPAGAVTVSNASLLVYEL